MDAETQSQIDDLVQLREVHKRRKQHLELQIVTLGLAAPAHLIIEAENAVSSILAIEATITRLRQIEVRALAAILPNALQNDISDVAIHERFTAVANYVLDVESAIHKEAGAILRLIDNNSMVDEKQRKSRQKRVDTINIAIVVLLFSIFVVLLLK